MICVCGLLLGLGAALSASVGSNSMENSLISELPEDHVRNIALQEILNREGPIADSTIRQIERGLTEFWAKDYVPETLGAHRIEYKCAPAIALAFASTRNGHAWKDVFDFVYPDSKPVRINDFPRTGICLLSTDIISRVILDLELKGRVVEASKLALLANENVSTEVAGKQDVLDNLSKLMLDFGGVDSARWLVQRGFLDVLNDYLMDLDNAWNINGMLAHPEDIVHSGNPAKAIEVFRNLDVACTESFAFKRALFQAALKYDDRDIIKFVGQEFMTWCDEDSIFAFASLSAIKYLKELNVFEAFDQLSACDVALNFGRIDVLQHAIELDPSLQCTDLHFRLAFEKGNRLFIEYFNGRVMDRDEESRTLIPTTDDYQRALSNGSIEGSKLILELCPEYYASDESLYRLYLNFHILEFLLSVGIGKYQLLDPVVFSFDNIMKLITGDYYAESPELFDWVSSQYSMYGIDPSNNPWLSHAHFPIETDNQITSDEELMGNFDVAAARRFYQNDPQAGWNSLRSGLLCSAVSCNKIEFVQWALSFPEFSSGITIACPRIDLTFGALDALKASHKFLKTPGWTIFSLGFHRVTDYLSAVEDVKWIIENLPIDEISLKSIEALFNGRQNFSTLILRKLYESDIDANRLLRLSFRNCLSKRSLAIYVVKWLHEIDKNASSIGHYQLLSRNLSQYPLYVESIKDYLEPFDSEPEIYFALALSWSSKVEFNLSELELALEKDWHRDSIPGRPWGYHSDFKCSPLVGLAFSSQRRKVSWRQKLPFEHPIFASDKEKEQVWPALFHLLKDKSMRLYPRLAACLLTPELIPDMAFEDESLRSSILNVVDDVLFTLPQLDMTVEALDDIKASIQESLRLLQAETDTDSDLLHKAQELKLA